MESIVEKMILEQIKYNTIMNELNSIMEVESKRKGLPLTQEERSNIVEEYVESRDNKE